MKQLPIRCKRGGFIYSLLMRSEKVAMYVKKSKAGFKSFEVFKIRKRHAVICNNDIGIIETMPSNEDFGYDAFAIWDFDRALRKYLMLGGEFYISRELKRYIRGYVRGVKSASWQTMGACYIEPRSH